MRDERGGVFELLLAAAVMLVSMTLAFAAEAAPGNASAAGIKKGVAVVLDDSRAAQAIQLAKSSELLVYVQLENDADVQAAREAVDAAGLYGTRVYVEKGAYSRIHLADNLADLVIAPSGVKVEEAEVLRVLNPIGKAVVAGKTLTKPFPEGADDWRYRFHGPDNNPQSRDKLARWPYLTQFLAEPWFSPMPQLTVASGGRVFEIYGHLGGIRLELAWYNTLVARNGYNGTILWKRPIEDGYQFMSHRGTVIATPEILYLGDADSCKLLDAATGELKGEIKVPDGAADGPSWKWMAIENGILYALVGEKEAPEQAVLTDPKKGMGGGWGWEKHLPAGFHGAVPPWGFGRTLLAFSLKDKSLLWKYREEDAVDSRSMCMAGGRIFFFRPEKVLGCLDAKTGKTIWRKTPADAADLFGKIGSYQARSGLQWYNMGNAICANERLFVFGQWLKGMFAFSASDGSLLWQTGSFDHLIAQDDALYAGGLTKLDPKTGKTMAQVGKSPHPNKAGREACMGFACATTTASGDRIFARGLSGSTSCYDPSANTVAGLTPMRPNCTAGVIPANGYLYWPPWDCECNVSLFGMICLGPAGTFAFNRTAVEAERLEQQADGSRNPAAFSVLPGEWSEFRSEGVPLDLFSRKFSKQSEKPAWEYSLGVSRDVVPTPPVSAGGLVFLGASDGIVRALDGKTGALKWKVYTGGPVRFPPTISEGRAYASSADGWVYCLEAATGRLLWRFRAAPEERKIMVYGALSSAWPVTPPVRVKDGVAYAAAGINNFDGTHIYALDARTGALRWQNNVSGHLRKEGPSGVCVAGDMIIVEDKLYLAGGNYVSPALYDLKTGTCLNEAPPALYFTWVEAMMRSWTLKVADGKVTAERGKGKGEPFYSPRSVFFEPFAENRVTGLCNAGEGRRIVVLREGKVLCCAGGKNE